MSSDLKDQEPRRRGMGCLLTGVSIGFVAGALVGCPYISAPLLPPLAPVLGALERIAQSLLRAVEPVYRIESRESFDYMFFLMFFFGVLGAVIVGGLSALVVLARRK